MGTVSYTSPTLSLPKILLLLYSDDRDMYPELPDQNLEQRSMQPGEKKKFLLENTPIWHSDCEHTGRNKPTKSGKDGRKWNADWLFYSLAWTTSYTMLLKCHTTRTIAEYDVLVNRRSLNLPITQVYLSLTKSLKHFDSFFRQTSDFHTSVMWITLKKNPSCLNISFIRNLSYN